MKNLFDKGTAEVLNLRFLSLTSSTPPAWGVMNAGQMICHCTDALREPLGLRPTRSSSNLLTSTVVKWITFYVLPWPQGKLPTSFEYDQHQGGTRPTEFDADRNELFRLLSMMEQQPDWFKFHPHPLFGKLSRREWGTLIWKHFDHHLRQFNV